MELQQIKYFREVAKREHVTRAAEKLFVSQSAISRAVTQLEEELGVPLFYRQGRAVMQSLLYGVSGTAISMIAMPMIALLAATACAAVPAVLRAVRINPVIMLRAE